MTPLQLEDSFLTVMEVRANPEFRSPEEGGSVFRPAIEPQVQMARLKSEERRYQLTLTVESAPDSEKSEQPYNLHFQIVGQLVVDQAFEHEELDRLIAVNGASMLYSSLREVVLMMTGRCAWGPVQLPTVNFNQLDMEDGE